VGDPLDRLMAFDYDRLNRTVKEYYVEELTTDVFTEIAGAPSTRYVYDLASNLKSRTDREGNVTEYRYDRLHRLRCANLLRMASSFARRSALRQSRYFSTPPSGASQICTSSPARIGYTLP
jgi:YD repeat-containing protein